MKYFLMLMLLLICDGPVLAGEPEHEAACNGLLTAAQNQVTSVIPALVVDESTTTTEDLAVMSGLYNDLGRTIGGITSASPLVEIEVVSNMALLPDQAGVCAKPSVNVRVGYQSLAVYMDRDIARASCIYNAIFAHEMHHVAIYKDYVTESLPIIQKSADAKFNGRPYYFPTLFQAKQYLEILGQVFAGHVRDQFMREVNARQSALDTQAEYARMQNECVAGGHMR